MRLKNKVIIITGGGQGIGRFYSLRLAEEGAKIVVADINVAGGQAVADEIKAKGQEAFFVRTDVSNEQSVQTMAKSARDKYGRIDVLVNNAAVFSTLGTKPFSDITTQEWDLVMAVNLRGIFLCCKSVVPIMKDQKKGKIINTSAEAWEMGRPGYLHYVTSKAGTVGFTNSLAREVGDWNINVNCISYAGTQTEIERKTFTSAHADAQMQQQCIKKHAMPEDLVGTLIFLASEDSDFLSGQTIHANGGVSCHC
jgi:3-oxoacyl-[acyl-carrier protein] reductase